MVERFITNEWWIYINRKSNHPPVVPNQLSKSVAKKISDISSDEKAFSNSTPTYSEAIRKSGFNDKFTYNTKTTDYNTSEKKKRKRKVESFNPPFSLNVEINMGKISLKLVKRYFPKENPLCKIFNKNKLKFSYSCMGNVAFVLSAHNRNILHPKIFWICLQW